MVRRYEQDVETIRIEAYVKNWWCWVSAGVTLRPEVGAARRQRVLTLPAAAGVCLATTPTSAPEANPPTVSLEPGILTSQATSGSKQRESGAPPGGREPQAHF
jgi:hypothetical protein